MRRVVLALTVLLAALPASAEDRAAQAKKARDEIGVLLTKLADDARRLSDVTAAQALAETASFVSGVPHPSLDALRRDVVRHFRDDEPWGFHRFVPWQPIHDRVWILQRATRDIDRVDGAIVDGLPGAVWATRMLSRARYANGLKPMRYDAKRSAKNVLLARAQAVPQVGEGDPKTYFMFGGGVAQTVKQALADVQFRAALFDPADKGITLGSAGEPEILHMYVIGLSGNRRVFSKDPAYVTYPPPRSVGAPMERLPRKGEKGVQPAPVTVHVFDPAIDLGDLNTFVVWESPPGELQTARWRATLRKIGRQRVVVIQPQGAFALETEYTVRLSGGDELVVDWSFTTRTR